MLRHRLLGGLELLFRGPLSLLFFPALLKLPLDLGPLPHRLLKLLALALLLLFLLLNLLRLRLSQPLLLLFLPLLRQPPPRSLLPQRRPPLRLLLPSLLLQRRLSSCLSCF
jgi:hypothetical protein